MEPFGDHKSGYVAFVGRPNVGKSTLMNQLIGQKLSIVTRKPQTTRHRVLGIITGKGYQIICLDTPGVIKPEYKLQEMMMHAVDRAIDDADLIVFMADARDGTPNEKVLERAADRPTILAINKMDLVSKLDAIPLVEAYSNLRAFESVVPISAMTGSNVDLLRQEIIDRLPPGPAYYPEEMISEHPERFFVSEIIREKVFKFYRQEIPYSTQVNIVAFEERSEGKDFIDAEIVVERETQKGIIIGRRGSGLKKLGSAAREDIEAFTERPVFLQLHVKVRDRWRNQDHFLRDYGYT